MADEPGTAWQRTSPVAVVLFVGQLLRQVLTHGLPAIVPLIAAFGAIEKLRWIWLGLGLLPVAGTVLAWAVLSYLRFQFRLADGAILVRQGVLHHEQLSIEFQRVQNVSIEEPFYMRPLGLAVLSIDTAGSGEKEVTLGGIGAALARRIRSAVLAGAGTPAGESGGAEEKAPAPAPLLLIERSPRRIALYGLTSNGLIWIAAALGAVAGVADDALTSRAEQVIKAGIGWAGEGGLLQVLLLTGAVLGAVLLLPALSVAGALVRHHGYRLVLDGETFRRRSGLLTRHENALKREKIQAVLRTQNLAARLLGLVTLRLEVARSGSGEENAGGIPLQSSFLVPALDAPEAGRLVFEFLPGCAPGPIEFSRPDARRFVGKALLLGWTPPILAASLVPAVFIHWVFLLLLPPAYGLAYWVVRRRWSRWGYAVDGGHAYVRTGFFGTTVRIFPLFKTQRVDLRQTPGQRRASLAHLTLHLASGSLTVPQMPLAHARRLRDLALYHVESTSRSWY